MKPSISLFPSLGLLLFLCVAMTSGCAQNKQAIARLEQENAQQRERIWRSNWKMEDFRRENETLRQQIATLQNSNRKPGSAASAAPAAQGTSAWGSTSIVRPIPGESAPASTPASAPASTGTPLSPAPSGTSASPAPAEMPVITPQPPATSLGAPSEPQNLPTNPATGSQARLGNGRQIHVRKTDSQNVHSVTLLPEKTRAIHYEGLHAEFQLRDAAGGILLAPAPLVVMVTDPSLSGEQSRISKWKYSAEDVADIINSGQAGLTIPLNMAWERACPQNLNLELHILYYTSDKRILVHRAPINLAPNAYPAGTETAAAPQGGLILGTSSPAVGSEVGNQPLSRPEWNPNP